jgi:hypothetical protein
MVCKPRVKDGWWKVLSSNMLHIHRGRVFVILFGRNTANDGDLFGDRACDLIQSV